MISGYDLHRVPDYPFIMEYSSRHWLDSLVRMQSSKSADVCARTFDTLRRYSLTEVGKERQTKHTGETMHYFHWYVCMYMHLYYVYACVISVICNFVGVPAAI